MDGGRLLPLLLLLAVVVLAVGTAAGGGPQQLTASSDVTEGQLGCLVSYLQSKGRRTVDIYTDRALNGIKPIGGGPGYTLNKFHRMATLPAEPTSNS